MPNEYVYFHKGLSYMSRSALEEPGSLQVAENIAFREEGKQELRPSFSKFTTTPYSASRNGIHSIRRFRDNLVIGDYTNLRWTNALVHEDFASLGSGFQDSTWTWSEYKDFVVGTNGTDSVMFDVNGNLYDTALSNPGEAPTAVAGAAGSPNDIYALYVTYYFEFPNGHKYETGFSPSVDITVASQKISWTNIPVSDYTALSGTEPTIWRKLYRGPGTGGTALSGIYWVATIEDNVTTSYTDNYTDAEVAANDASTVDDYIKPPAFLYNEFHYGRWYGIRETFRHRLYYTMTVNGVDAEENETLMPIAYEENSWDDIRTPGFGRMDPKGLIAWGTYLYIPLAHTWMRKQGNDPDTWSFKKTWAGFGVAAPGTIAKCGNPNGLLALSNIRGKNCGLTLFNGQTSQVITSPKFDYIFEQDLNQDAIESCRGDWDGRYYHLLYPSGTNTVPNKWIALDLKRFPDIRAAHWEDLNGRCIHVDEQTNGIYIGGNDGFVRDNTLTESINVDVQTHDLVSGDPKMANTAKTLKEMNYAINTGGNDVTLEFYIDGTVTKWPDDTTTKTISGTNDSVQTMKSFPTNWTGYKYSIRIYGSNLDTFELYSPWDLEFDLTM